jgi:hypothetical protein
MTTQTMSPAQKAWATRKANWANEAKAVREGKATIDGFAPTKKSASFQPFTACGWCMTGDCAKCRVSMSYYETTWSCSCTCPKKGK